MADNTESGATPQEGITFKVKSSGDKVHTLTMPESATIGELKAKLATEEFENIPAERQRLIYSGRVMKNDDTLATYKVKPNNTIHLVKSAASNPTPPPASSASAPAVPSIPTNMAAGTANNPLAGLTGARYAGHVQLPNASMFGADGGMGPPPSPDEIARMMSDPTVQQTMNAALDNPDFLNMLISSNPTLRNLPNAREMLQSPFMRQMMTNPDMIRMVTQMQGGGGMPAFPAPGATDDTPADAPASGANANAGAGTGAGGLPQQLPSIHTLFPGLAAAGGAPGAGGQGATQGDPAAAGAGAGAGAGGELPQNPFLSLLNPGAVPGAQGAAGGNPDLQRSLQEFLANMAGGAGGLGGLGGMGMPPPAPADNRPPEERYAEQLRQLNDMGFYDFDRNVAALRRSGGSVQGAIEHLLGGS